MNTLLIIFDVNITSTVTQAQIINTVKQQGSWAKLSSNAWLLKTSKSAIELRDELIRLTYASRLVVFDVSRDGWATSYSDEVSSWIKDNL